MDKTYYLDLDTVVAYLNGQTATLSTKLSVPGVAKTCKGFAFVQNGKLVGMVIRSKDGKELDVKDPYQLLRSCSEWSVRFEANPTPTPSEVSPARSDSTSDMGYRVTTERSSETPFSSSPRHTPGSTPPPTSRLSEHTSGSMYSVTPLPGNSSDDLANYRQSITPPPANVPIQPPVTAYGSPDAYIPKPLLTLSSSMLVGRSMQQRLVLRMVFSMVNGQRSIEQIKAQLNLPPEVVDEALQFLHYLHAIE